MTSINVSQRTQMIVVDVASRTVSIINAGPAGPAGPTGEVSLAQMDTALALKVAKAGDTMTGALTIPVTPTAVGHATSKQYVDTAISNAVTALLDGTPGALDTLNELAAALGDDANFAASVTTALAGKQPLDSDLTALAGLATTAWGRQVLTLADSAAALTYLGAAPAADLTSHVALKNAHGVTRELVTFTAATPVHISGNLLTHDQQRMISGWNPFGGSSVHAPTGGPDGGGERTVTASSTSSFGMNSEYIACAPGDVRTYTIRFRASEAVASGDVYVTIVFLDSSFGYISSSFALPVVPAGVDSTVTLTTPPGGCPAGTAWIGVQIYRFTGHTVGSTLSASVACLRTSPTIPDSSGVAGVNASLSASIRVSPVGDLVITPCWTSGAQAYVGIGDLQDFPARASTLCKGNSTSFLTLESTGAPWTELVSPPATPVVDWAWVSVDARLRSTKVTGDTLLFITVTGSVNGGEVVVEPILIEKITA